MSTRKPDPKKTANDETALLRARCKALETELVTKSARLEELDAKHTKLLAELKRRASGLPLLSRMVGIVLEMHGKDTAGRALLIAVAKAITEMREFNRGDALPGDDEDKSAPAASTDDMLRRYGDGEPGTLRGLSTPTDFAERVADALRKEPLRVRIDNAEPVKA